MTSSKNPTLSQTDLAEALCRAAGRDTLTRTEIRKWENGKVVPGRFWLGHLSAVLGLPLELLRLARRPVATGLVTDMPIVSNGGLGVLNDSVASVIWDGGSEVDRRQFVASSASALAALALPDLEAITRHTRAAGASVRVGEGEVLAVRRMTTVLGDAASELGGGHARHLTIRYLTEDVQPWLTGTYTEAIGRDLFAATSQLVHLAGWMAADEGKNDLANKYYKQSRALADEAGDPELAATALRGMAIGAIDLGHNAEAVQFAQDCVQAAAHMPDNPKATAYYQATLANAAALDGDRHTAITALAASQTAIERAPDIVGESWASHYSTGRWAHETGMILAHLGDLDAAADHLHHALDIHGLDRRRTRAIVLADLGQVQLRRDDIDAAIGSWTEFLDCADGIRSVKVTDALAEMRARLTPLHRVAGVAELEQRAAAEGSPLGTVAAGPVWQGMS